MLVFGHLTAAHTYVYTLYSIPKISSKVIREGLLQRRGGWRAGVEVKLGVRRIMWCNDMSYDLAWNISNLLT